MGEFSRRDLPPRMLDAAVELIGRTGHLGTLPMEGESMLPILRPGQRVAVEFSLERLDRGDLLLYRQQDYLVVHRLLGTACFPDGRPCLRTRGDNMPGLDPPLDRARVLGRVVAIENDDGWRDLRGAGAKLYALALALHDLAWAVAAVAGSRADGALRRLGVSGGVRRRIEYLDRRLQRWAHSLLFERLHPLCAEPGVPRG